VTFTDVLPTAATITIYRTADARTEEVRGGTDLSAATPFAMDYEVALGVTNSWRAQMFASDGTDLGFTGAVTLDVPGDEGMWLQQPLAPETAIRVRLAIESGATMSKPTPAEIIYPEGAAVGRIIGGRRRGVSGMTIRLYAELEDLARVDAMFGSYEADYPSVLLLRTPPPWRFPRVFFMGIPDPEEFREGMYALAGYRMVATEVAPPYPGLVRALLRRKDIDAAYATRAARAAAYPTRLARDQDYSLAGFGG
jgi:hypothetical protein